MKQRASGSNVGSLAADFGSGARLDPESLGSAPPAVIVTTPQALAALVRNAVSEAMNDVRQDAVPLLLDRTSAARALGIGTSSIDRFRKAGMPCVWVGDAPRFIVDECLAWLREHRRVQEDPE